MANLSGSVPRQLKMPDHDCWDLRNCRIAKAFLLLSLGLAEGACGLPPADNELERNFRIHQREFTELATMFERDVEVVSLGMKSAVIRNVTGQASNGAKLIEDITVASDDEWREYTRHGLSRERFAKYAELFRILKLNGLGRNEDRIYMPAEPVIEDLYAKGFVYSGVALQGCVSDLDGYKPSEQDRMSRKSVCKNIASHWYLFRVPT